MNNSFYFQHDYNARNDQKILELRAEYGAEGYGIWWMLLETLAEQDEGIDRGAIGGLSLAYGVDKQRLLAIIDFCIDLGLLYEQDGYLKNKRMDAHKNWRNELQEAGKKGAEKRWKRQNNRGANGHPNAQDRTGQDRTEQDSKGNEKKGNHLFKNSPYYDKEKFKQAFKGTKYENYDLEYYYEAVKNWSESKDVKRKDWIAQARNFMLKDNKSKSGKAPGISKELFNEFKDQ